MNKITRYICAVAIFTALMCVIAPISIPMVPVPITLATLMVYLISALFSFKIAPLIVALYVALGALGLPVFSNFSSGAAVIMGPTGGFILGYILSAMLESLLITLNKNKKWMYPVAMVLGTVIIYAFGSAWFMYYMGGKYSFGQTMMACVVPFLIGDCLKIACSSVISIRLRKFFDTQLKEDQPKSGSKSA